MAVAGAIAGGIARLAGGSVVMDKLAGGIDKLAKAGNLALSGITNLASSITGGLLSPLGAVRDLFQTIGHLVGLFNPAIVTRFTLALNDTLAVLGSALMPVLEGMTTYVRTFGDALAGLLPVIQPLFDAIGDYIGNFAQGLLPLIEAAAPFLQLFVDTMTLLLDKLAVGVAFLQGVVAELIRTIAALFGLESQFNRNAKSSGFAVRQVSVSSVEEFANRMFESAAKNIYGRQIGEKKKDPADLLGDIKKAMEEGRALIANIKDNIQNIWDWIQKNGKAAADTAAGDAAAGAAGIAGARSVDEAIAAAIRAALDIAGRKPW